MNMADGVPGGLWLDESLVFAQLLERDGHVDALELTGGSPLLNPMYLFRGAVPIREMAATQTGLVKLGMRMLGRLLFEHYPYDPCTSATTLDSSARRWICRWCAMGATATPET
ncbi:hypothetical protein [Nocardia sp. NPDC003963]